MTYRELAIWQEEDGQIRHKAFTSISALVDFVGDRIAEAPAQDVWNIDVDGDWYLSDNEISVGSLDPVETENIPPHIKLYVLMLGNWSES